MSTPPEPDRSFEPVRSRRTFGPAPLWRRLEDARDRAIVLRAFLWSVAGLILGVALGIFLHIQHDLPLWIVVACGFVGWAFVFTLPLVISYSAGRAATTIYAPSGRSTPRPREHSRAETLVARGLYADAVEELLKAAEADPSEPSARLRAARILRDHLGDHDHAAAHFRGVLRSGALATGPARAVRRELIELYVHRMGSPERAAPELARLAEESAGSAEGAWAAALLAEVKEHIGRDPADG